MRADWIIRACGTFLLRGQSLIVFGLATIYDLVAEEEELNKRRRKAPHKNIAAASGAGLGGA